MNKFKDHVIITLRLLKTAWNVDKKLCFLYFLTPILGVSISFLIYYLYGLMIDEISSSLNVGQSQLLFLIIVTYLFFNYVSLSVYNTLSGFYVKDIFVEKFCNFLVRQFCQKSADLDFANLEDGEVQSLIAKVEDSYVTSFSQNLDRLIDLLSSIFSLTLSFFVALRFDLFLHFLVLIIVSIPFFYFRVKYGRASWSLASYYSQDQNRLWYLRGLFDEFSTLSEIKFYQLKDHFIDKIKKLQDHLLYEPKKQIQKYVIASVLTSALIPVVIYVMINNFVSDIFANKFSVGDFSFFLNTVLSFSREFSSLLMTIGLFTADNLFLADYFKFLDLKNKVQIDPDSIVLKKPFSVIEFRNVSFSYPGSKKLRLKNINLTIHRGENIAIVGHNGAGKTTLIKLLLRFYDPTEGEILIDGINLKKINLDSWYQQLGILFQSFPKYRLTLKENVQIGNILNDNEALVIETLKKAGAEDLLKLPNGLNQMIGI